MKSAQEPPAAIAGQICAHLAERFPTSCEPAGNRGTPLRQCGLAEPAIDYWSRLDSGPARRSANAEALNHLARGLELLLRSDDPTLRNSRVASNVARPLPRATKGWSVDSVKRAYTRALQLCKESGFDGIPCLPCLVLWTWNFLRAALGEAQALAEHLVNTAENADDSVFKVLAHEALGFTLFARGTFAAAHRGA